MTFADPTRDQNGQFDIGFQMNKTLAKKYRTETRCRYDLGEGNPITSECKEKFRKTPNGQRRMPNSQGESKSGLAAAPAGAVFERQHSAVSFGDLAAEREADARPAGFGGEERDEEV
jgi:hypothetical protein